MLLNNHTLKYDVRMYWLLQLWNQFIGITCQLNKRRLQNESTKWIIANEMFYSDIYFKV
jgi:hypothetical protein